MTENDEKKLHIALPSFAVGFTFNSLFKTIRTPANTMVLAAGKFSENKNYNLVEAFANLYLSIILANIIGTIAGTIDRLN